MLENYKQEVREKMLQIENNLTFILLNENIEDLQGISNLMNKIKNFNTSNNILQELLKIEAETELFIRNNSNYTLN